MKISNSGSPAGLHFTKAAEPKNDDGSSVKSAGREHSPAHRARALIAQNPALQDRPFGQVVSLLARGETIELESGSAGDAVPVTETPASPTPDSPTADEPTSPLDVTA